MVGVDRESVLVFRTDGIILFVDMMRVRLFVCLLVCLFVCLFVFVCLLVSSYVTLS